MIEAKTGMSAQLEAFAANAIEYMKRERTLLLDGVGIPEISTDLADRQVLLVAASADTKAQLKSLKKYISDFRPVLVGVDGGADALRAAGYKPALIIGNPETIDSETLRCGAEVVIPAHTDGHAPGLERLQDLGVGAVTFPASGSTEDLALLLADGRDASMIVTVGMRTTLIDLLDRGRGSTASTFLVRMRVANKVVEAPGGRRAVPVPDLLVGGHAADPGGGAGDGGGADGVRRRRQLRRPRPAVVERAGRLGQGALLMISMRYHIVSLAAIFLALALGIVLGATKISSPLMTGLQSDNADLSSQHDELTTTNKDLTDRVAGGREVRRSRRCADRARHAAQDQRRADHHGQCRPGRPGCGAVPAEPGRRHRHRADPGDQRLQRSGPGRRASFGGRRRRCRPA